MIELTIKNRVLNNPYIKSIDFAIYGEDKVYHKEDFELSLCENEKGFVFTGENSLFLVKWTFVKEYKGVSVSLKIEKKEEIVITRIDNFILELDKSMLSENFVIPHLGSSLFNFAGNKTVADLKEECDVRVSGLFESTSSEGFMLAEMLPLKFLYKIRIKNCEDTIRFEPFTKFTAVYYNAKELESQKTLVFDGITLSNGMEALSEFIPKSKKRSERVFGWNSWDYYFSSVTHDDIMENLEFIKNDKVLSQNIKYITIDDGWQYMWGDWVENHKFKDGMKYTADKIKEAGFVPGIWVAPIQIVPTCDIALWHGDMLLKGENGDPYYGTITNQYNLDPTHPESQKFLRKLFTKLYNDGYRLFKIDFLCQFRSNDDFKDNIQAKHFYDKEAGPYDALRELFRIIRECVTEESHILGCSLPVECGADVVDSGRISIDMHNWQGCTEKVADSLEWAYIYHGKVWNNDVDFLVVRGPETSDDKVLTNCVAQRKDYRLGDAEKISDFSYIQARTWTNFVMISGGNVFLSDKLTALNEKGIELLRTAVQYKAQSSVKPVYLENELRASLWITDEAALIVNWAGEEKTITVSADMLTFNVENVKDIHTGKAIEFKNGKLSITLAPYDSLMIVK